MRIKDEEDILKVAKEADIVQRNKTEITACIRNKDNKVYIFQCNCICILYSFCTVSILLRQIPRSAITGSYGKGMFNFARSCQTVFWSDCTNSHFHQRWLAVPAAPNPHQHLMLSEYEWHLEEETQEDHPWLQKSFPRLRRLQKSPRLCLR